jgi:hypothetical protein
MDFKDVMGQLSDRTEKLKDNLQTEEATKTALIMPFIQALGYDVFNPVEVIPEYVCDIGAKKGEKIDYAIMKDGEPIILIECKHIDEDLNLHDNQLLRYFHVSPAKFGILTNGMIYKFYTDLETANKMDEKPFLEINMLDLRNNQIDELKKFHKTYFDIENILTSANELKYTSELKSVLISEFSNPSPDLVKFLVRKIHHGVITSKILDQFTFLVKKSIANHINDIIADRLKNAIEREKTNDDKIEQKQEKKELPEGVVYMSDDGTIVTTQEEIDGFNIVKAILYEIIIDIERVTCRDAQSYFSILFDDNNRKPICRLYFNSQTVKYVSVFDSAKKEFKNKIESLADIYKYSKELRDIVSFYLAKQ